MNRITEQTMGVSAMKMGYAEQTRVEITDLNDNTTTVQWFTDRNSAIRFGAFVSGDPKVSVIISTVEVAH